VAFAPSADARAAIFSSSIGQPISRKDILIPCRERLPIMSPDRRARAVKVSRQRPTSGDFQNDWGLRMKARYMHDLGSLTLLDAVQRHKGEATQVEHSFRNLTATQQQVLAFL
jgi:hypothetical protein